MTPKLGRRAARRQDSEQHKPLQHETTEALDALARVFWRAAMAELEDEMDREELLRSGQKPTR